MDPKVIIILVMCVSAIFLTGCTTQSPGPGVTVSVPATVPTTPATVPTVPVAECTGAADCVPAECCHPSGCVKNGTARSCAGIFCTMVCSGPLDCGAGTCGCVNGSCAVVPASSDPSGRTGITITVSPRRYSPIMSSTPGIGLEPVTTGFGAGTASFTWKASYGEFLSWNSTDFRVNQLGDFTTNNGEKIYWSFIDKPTATATPVTISVTATDSKSGQTLGSSAVTLSWDGDYTVTVKE